MGDPPKDDAVDIALRDRIPALERVLGPCESVMQRPIPFYVGGKISVARFDRCPGITGEVRCTVDLTGNWGSQQQTGGKSEFELLIALRPHSPLAPTSSPDAGDRASVVPVGLADEILYGIGRYTTKAIVRSGDTLGPLSFAAGYQVMQALFHDVSSDKRPFEFGGCRYRLMLVILITMRELELARKEGSAALIRELRIAGVYPYSDPERESVV